MLIKDPERVRIILSSIRDAVPLETPVTAKIRLGFDSADNSSDIIGAIKHSGISELCVHARTKEQAYRPPAHWERVAEARNKLDIPVIINGEIWNRADALQAQKASGCQDIMLGRGAVTYPDLALDIQSYYKHDNSVDYVDYKPLEWEYIWEKIQQQARELHRKIPKYAGMRTKQWLRYLREHYPQARSEFERIKRCRRVDEMLLLWNN